MDNKEELDFFPIGMAILLIIGVLGIFGLAIIGVYQDRELEGYDDFCMDKGYDYANYKPYNIHRLEGKFIDCIRKNLKVDIEGRVTIERIDDTLIYSEDGD